MPLKLLSFSARVQETGVTRVHDLRCVLIPNFLVRNAVVFWFQQQPDRRDVLVFLAYRVCAHWRCVVFVFVTWTHAIYEVWAFGRFDRSPWDDTARLETVLGRWADVGNSRSVRLSAANCNIRTLPPHFFEMAKPSVINLTGNPIDCHPCQLQWITFLSTIQLFNSV